jgi:alpha-galactosidase
MDTPRRALVREAVALAKQLRSEIVASTPFWPLGVPSWDAEWTSLGLATPQGALVTVWNRDPAAASAELRLPAFAGAALELETLFPRHLPEWNTHWDAETGTLRVDSTHEVGARVFRLHTVQP